MDRQCNPTHQPEPKGKNNGGRMGGMINFSFAEMAAAAATMAVSLAIVVHVSMGDDSTLHLEDGETSWVT
jgi:hypothetical protein